MNPRATNEEEEGKPVADVLNLLQVELDRVLEEIQDMLKPIDVIFDAARHLLLCLL